ncbi:hypothetical protein P5G50_06845 [Leifsonia sp. F6_8S_P_1B]|uniref:Peptidase n=1 Tax=Leifsonia williamsii TaxID=3035919 RepID=A0ABT8K9N4_9MICO|nr:hypothetical protein [Leifsonia williamsii]MDN4614168.1 hypothetical protein [Leifsonia williamsii]
MYDESLAFTGLGTVVIGSAVLDLWWVAAGAGVAIVLGIGVARLAARRRAHR